MTSQIGVLRIEQRRRALHMSVLYQVRSGAPNLPLSLLLREQTHATIFEFVRFD